MSSDHEQRLAEYLARGRPPEDARELGVVMYYVNAMLSDAIERQLDPPLLRQCLLAITTAFMLHPMHGAPDVKALVAEFEGALQFATTPRRQ